MATRLIALLLLAASLLPIAQLIPKGEADPEYAARMLDWGLGFALCGVVGLLVWFVTRRRGATPVVSTVVPARSVSHDRAFLVVVAGGAFVLYAGIALNVFSGRPLLIDEVVQVLQAQDLARGELTHAVPEPREFFSLLNVIDTGPRGFGQYPVGGPMHLLPGVVLGASWFVGPVLGTLCVLLFWLLVGRTDPLASVRWRRSTTVLFALTPFAALMFGSHMNHVATLLWTLVALIALGEATRDEARDGASPWWGAVIGFAFGMAAMIRPLDAAAFAVPAGAWLVWRAGSTARTNPNGHRAGARRTVVAAAIGLAVPLGALLWSNAATTGHPLRFGYDLLWGASHGLGFHVSPWGAVHTPARGVELISLALTRLSTYLFETPFPGLLVPAAGLWLTRNLRALDRYLLAASACLLMGYWAYWHDGFYLGPRFLFPLVPVAVLWTARAFPLLRDRMGAGTAAWRGVRTALGAGIAYAVVTVLIVRVPSYANSRQSMRVAVEEEAEAAGARRALVLVQESWGAQLLVRLWARGVSRTDAERLYSHIDACVLETRLGALEREDARGEAALARLRPLLADSARLVASDRSPDGTLRTYPGLQYTPLCEARLAEDRLGYLLYAPWRLARDGNVYARWLPGREAEISAAYPGRAVYRVGRAGTAPDAPLRWERLIPSVR